MAVKFTRSIVNSGIADPTGLAFLDLNGDKRQDIVAISSGWNTDQMLWHKSNSNGTISTNYVIINPNAVGSRNAIYGIDLDRNGSIDIAAAETGDDDINVWYNIYADGSSWAGAEKANSFDGANKVYAADYGYDGYPDIVATAGGQNDLAIWRQTSSGSFTKTDIDTSLSNASAVYGGDIDGDGWQDVIAGGSAGVYWYRNLGNGTSWSKTTITTTLQAEDIKTADFNKDNRLDAVIATSTGIHVWINTGSGGRIITVASLNAKQVAVADIDLDGDDDLVFGSYSTGASLYWYSNNGNETFTPYLIDSGSLNSIYAVATGDADNDGFFDIAIGTHGDDDIYWYRNELRRLSIEAGTAPSEPNIAGYFKFSMDEPPLETIKLSSMYSVYSAAGEATINTDYTTSQYVMNAGSPIQYQYIYPINDLVYDHDEQVTFILTGNGIENGYVIDSTKSRATVKIADPNPVVSIGTINSPTEGGNVGTIEIRLNTNAPTSGLRIPYKIEGSYNDIVIYNDSTLSASGILNGEIPVAAGVTQTTLYVFANDDNTYEFGEEVTLTLLPEKPEYNGIASGTGYRIDKAKNKATLKVNDNEPVVSLGFFHDMREGSPSGDFVGYVDVEVDREVTKQPGLNVYYEISAGTATQFTDYFNTQGRLTSNGNAENTIFIPYGAKSARLYLNALPDSIAENTETIAVSLIQDRNPNTTPDYAKGNNYAIGTSNSVTVSIVDSGDYAASLAILDRAGNAVTTDRPLEATSQGKVEFGIRLTSQPLADVYVVVGTTTLTFTAMNWDKTQTMTWVGTESITVTSTSSDSSYQGLRSVVSITAEDSRPNLELTEGDERLPMIKPTASISVEKEATEGSGIMGVFTIQLSNPAPAGGLVVNYQASGTSIPSTDYQKLSGQLTIAAGETQAALNISVIDDDIMESNETIIVALQASGSYSVSASGSTAELIIADDDMSGIVFAKAQETASITNDNEQLTVSVLSFSGSSGVFTVGLMQEPATTVTVALMDSYNGINRQSATFTPENWQLLQVLTLNDLRETASGEQQYELTALIESQDASVPTQTVTYPVIKNSIVTPITNLLTTEGQTETVLVKLNSQPSSDVSVVLSEVDLTENSFSAQELIITPQNWNLYQSLQVRGLEDQIADGDVTYNFKLTTSSIDSAYNGQYIFMPTTTTDIDEDIINNEPENDDNNEIDPLVTISIVDDITIPESDGNGGVFRISVGQDANGETVNVRYSVLTRPEQNDASEGVDYQSFSFFEQQVGNENPFSDDYGSYSAPTVVDLDLDDDLDLVLGNYAGVVLYYENVGSRYQATYLERTSSPFAHIDLNGNTSPGYSTPTFTDLDGDGDQDLVVGSNDGTLRYYLNSNLTFTEQNGSSNPVHGIDVGTYSAPAFVDLDSDGDQDLFVGTGDGLISFFQNTGTQYNPKFVAAAEVNPFFGLDLGDNTSVVFNDLDADRDLDAVLTADSNANAKSIAYMQYWLNIGSPAQPEFVQDNSLLERSEFDIPDNVRTVFGDIDGDSDADLLMGNLDGVINYYANLSSGELSVLPGQYVDVRLTPLHDSIAEGDESVSIILNTNNGYYIDSANNTITFTIKDDDIAGVKITDSAGAATKGNIYSSSEADLISQSFYVELTSQPTDNVTVFLGSTLKAEASLSADMQEEQDVVTLYFTPSNWNTAQGFTVNPKDDHVDDDTVEYAVNAIVRSGDVYYNRLAVDSISLANQDNDSAGVSVVQTIEPSGDVSINTLQVSLTTQPKAPVYITLTPGLEVRFSDQLISQPLTLTFTERNWTLPQTVSVIAVDDSKVEYNHNSSITFEIDSEDSKYALLTPPPPIDINIRDNDLPVVSLTVTQNAAEDSLPGYFTVMLSEATSEDSAGVTVAYQVLASSTAINGFDYQTLLQTGTVRIPPGKTSSYLPVSPIDNFVDEGDKQVMVQLLSGEGYKLGDTSTNTLVISNNDKAGVQVIYSGIEPVVNEGRSNTFYVSLLSEPTQATTISFSDTPNELDDVRSITFQPDNWYKLQAVTISGTDDNKAENPDDHQTTLAFTFTGATEYTSLDPVSLNISLIDRTFDSVDASLGLRYSLESFGRAFNEAILPLVGTSSNLPVFFDEITDRIASRVYTSLSLTAWDLEKIWREELSAALGSELSNLQVTYTPTSDDTPFTVSFTTTYLDQTVPLAPDLALPVLAIGVGGSVQVDITHDFTLGFGFLKSGGYYLDSSKSSLNSRIKLDELIFDGNELINGLSVDLQDRDSVFDLDYTITMDPRGVLETEVDDLSSSQRVSSNQLAPLLGKTSQELFSYFNYEFSEASDVSLALAATADPAITSYFPGLEFCYEAKDIPLINYADSAKAERVEFYVYIQDAALDVQSLARGFAKKYVDMIDKILQPIYPIIDTLNSDTKFLSALKLDFLFDGNNDGKVSVLEMLLTLLNFDDNSGDTDLLKNVGVKGFDDGDTLDFYEFIDAINRLIEVVRIVDDYLDDDVTFTRFLVNSEIEGPTGIAITDLNGDKYNDIVAISSGGLNDKLLWHPNSGNTFAAAKIISDNEKGDRNALYGADMDGDKDIDIVTAESLSDNIVVFYNSGEGMSWTTQKIPEFYDGVNKVYVADYDYIGDNYPDIVATASAENGLAIWRQTSKGSFSRTNIDTSLINASAVYGGDIDKDGRRDVIAGGDGGVYWYQNLDNGTSWSKRAISTTLRAQDIRLAKLNNDAYLDAVIATDSGIYTWTYNGSVTNIASLNAKQVAVADIDKDGDQDIIAGGFNAGASLYWYSNDGDGRFTPFLIDRTGLNYIDAIAAEDADNDGYIDIAIGTDGEDDIYWYRNDLLNDANVLIDIGSVEAKVIGGDLEFTNIEPVTGDILERIKSNPLATDDLVKLIDAILDLDGLELPLLTDFLTVAKLLTGEENVDFMTYDIPDLAVDLSVDLSDIGLQAILPEYGLDSILRLDIGLNSNLYLGYDDYGLDLWREEVANNRKSDDVVFTRFGINSAIADPTSLAFLDLNGDKYDDIAAISSGGDRDQLLWHRNDAGTFITNPKVLSEDDKGERNALYGADMDDDNDTDIVTAETGSDAISVWYNNDDGKSWSSEKRADSYDGANKVYLSDYDYNGDNYPDIVATAGAQNTLAIWRQSSSGVYTRTDIDTGLINASAVYGGDIDKDGRRDVIAGGSGGVYWYQNLDNGTSWEKHTISTTLQAQDIKLAKLDSDGKLDAIIATESGIYAWMNGGAVKNIASINAKQVAVSDIDKDGDQDIVAGGFSSGASLYWYSNDGDGRFTPYLIDDANLNYIYSIATGDADNDGFTDIAIGTHGGDEIHWYRNESFNADVLLEGLYIRDVNKDGKDVSELSASFGVAIGLEANAVVARARMTGGVQSDNEVKIDFMDTDETIFGSTITPTRDGLIRYQEFSPLFSGDLSVLDVSGAIEAFLNTKIEVGLDVGTLFEVMETILDIDVYKYKIWDAEYALSKVGINGFASQSSLQGGTVFLDANFNARLDPGEPGSTSNADGSFNLIVDRIAYDRNRNGFIDSSEGRLVIMGGVDSATGLPMTTPLFAPVDSTMITPLTSLIQKLQQAGIDQQLAAARIKRIFGLSPTVELSAYNPASAINAGDESARQVYVAHVMVQAAFALFTQFLAGAVNQSAEQVSDRVIETISLALYEDVDASLEAPNFIHRIVGTLLHEFDAWYSDAQTNEIASVFSRILTVSNQIFSTTAASCSLEEMVSKTSPLKAAIQHDLAHLLGQFGKQQVSASYVDRSLHHWQARVQNLAGTSNLEALALAMQSMGLSLDEARRELVTVFGLPASYEFASYPMSEPADEGLRLQIATLEHQLSVLFTLAGQVLQAGGISDPLEASWLISRSAAAFALQHSVLDLGSGEVIREIVDFALSYSSLTADKSIEESKTERIAAVVQSLAILNSESSNPDDALARQRQLIEQSLDVASTYHYPLPLSVELRQAKSLYAPQAIDTQFQIAALSIAGPYLLAIKTRDGRSIPLLENNPGGTGSSLANPGEAITFDLLMGSESKFFGSLSNAPNGLAPFTDAGMELVLTIGDQSYSSLTPGQLELSSRGPQSLALAFRDGSRVVGEFSLNTPVFLTPGFSAAEQQGVDLVIGRSASYENTIGIYRVDDLTGSLVSGERTVKPGDADYARLAVERAQASGLVFASPANMSTDLHRLQLPGASNYGFFLIVNNNVDGYLNAGSMPVQALFSYHQANPEQRQSFVSLGNNLYGFEDSVDNDMNDIVMRLMVNDV